MNAGTNRFWEFSLSVWENKRLREACIRLQDRHTADTDIDLNIILFCVWAAAAGFRELNAGEIMGAMEATAYWRKTVVRPLLAVRKRLETGVVPIPPTLAREVLSQVKIAELESEKIEQLMLERIIDPPPYGSSIHQATAANVAATGFAHYFSRIGMSP